MGAEGARANTDLYYARQLVQALRRIHETTFHLSAIPLGGRVPDIARQLLREATRSYFFGLELGCVSLCRANLESTLTTLVPTAELEAERRRNPRSGQLQRLICAAGACGRLSEDLVEKAQAIRRAANAVLHGDRASPIEPIQVLRDLREVLGALFPD